MTDERFLFGECTLRIAARELCRDGARVELPPRIFDCLVYLIRHRDRAIGRDELLSAAWGKVNLGEAVLVKAILSIRRAIGDTAEDQVFIRTIPRFGYHWVGGVTVTPSGPVAAPDARKETVPSAHRRRALLGALVAAVLVVAVPVAMVMRAPGTAEAPPEVAQTPLDAGVRAIIVMPAEVEGLTDDAWLRLGLMDLLANRLRDGGLAVMPSDSVVRLLKAGGAPADDPARVMAATGGSIVVRLLAQRSASGWVLRASWREARGEERTVYAHGDDAIAATREIAARLLEQQDGHRPPEQQADREATLEDLAQRLEVARLTDDLDLARELLRQATPALRGSPEIRLREAQIDIRAGAFDSSAAALTALLDELPADTQFRLRVQALNLLGIATQRLGRLDDSVERFTEAISLLKTNPQPIYLARLLVGRGGSLALQRRYTEAAEDFARAHVNFTMAGDLLTLPWVEANEGTLAMDRGRLDSAVPMLERAAAAFRRAGFLNEEFSTASNLTQLHLLRLKPAQAMAASDDVLLRNRTLKDAGVLAHFNLWRQHALLANGRLSEASELADSQLALQRVAQFDVFRSAAHGVLARLHHEQGRYEQAIDHARHAVDGLVSEARFWDLRADAWLVLVRATRAVTPDRGAMEAAALVRWASASPVPDDHPLAALVQAEQAAADEKQESTAAALYEKALAQADAIGTPRLIAEVARSYGGHLIARGDLERATAVIGKVSRWTQDDYDCAILQAYLYVTLGDRSGASRDLAGVASRLAGQRRVPDALMRELAGVTIPSESPAVVR